LHTLLNKPVVEKAPPTFLRSLWTLKLGLYKPSLQLGLYKPSCTCTVQAQHFFSWVPFCNSMPTMSVKSNSLI
jgi:hypothetical protein